MAIYLVQHGMSLAKNIDPERGLSDEGIKEVKIIASVAENYKVPVNIIVHSGKKRTKQTADIFAKALCPNQGVIEIEGIKPMDDVNAFAETVDISRNMMVVGHLPFMEKLVALVVAGNEELCVFKFQNGGIVCLDSNQENGWHIKWSLMPNIP